MIRNNANASNTALACTSSSAPMLDSGRSTSINSVCNRNGKGCSEPRFKFVIVANIIRKSGCESRFSFSSEFYGRASTHKLSSAWVIHTGH